MSPMVRRLRDRAQRFRRDQQGFDAKLLDEAADELENLCSADTDGVIDWLGTGATLEDMQRIAITIKQRCAELGGEIEGSTVQ